MGLLSVLIRLIYMFIARVWLAGAPVAQRQWTASRSSTSTPGTWCGVA
jgi:hypothetical protein